MEKERFCIFDMSVFADDIIGLSYNKSDYNVTQIDMSGTVRLVVQARPLMFTLPNNIIHYITFTFCQLFEKNADKIASSVRYGNIKQH